MYMASRSAAAVASSTSNSSYEKYVNPQWVNLLNILDTYSRICFRASAWRKNLTISLHPVDKSKGWKPPENGTGI
jgi:hypothetical protein